jgi:PhnB protein
MPQLCAYLSFDGNCAEAMRFYERTLGGRLEDLLRFADTPAADSVPEASRNRIMHAYLVLPDGSALMAGDAPTEQPFEPMRGVAMTLTFPNGAEAQRVFAALAEDGRVQMPMGPTFWAAQFGMLTDRFGTPWIVNGELRPV